MSLSATKCSFGYKTVEILGIKTDGQTFWLPDSRLKAIPNLKPPTKKTLLSLHWFPELSPPPCSKICLYSSSNFKID